MMGCLHSRTEASELHGNVFRVMNIDENGLDLCSGQLQITESDIILYREGRESTVWPLHSLRRYGFEGEIFSFESGRRCETGEGIYAFRCHRASVLFRMLQQQIQLRNVMHDSTPYPVSRLPPSPQGRQTLQANVVHRSSVDNGAPEIENTTVHTNNVPISRMQSGQHVSVTPAPRSPSSADILEVMPLYPRAPPSGNQVTNVYQVRDFKREHNNNQSEVPDPPHVYSNDLNRDLAILRNTLRQETALNNMRDIEDETRILEARYINEESSSKHPSIVSSAQSNSGLYTQLSVEQQVPPRLYMNITLTDKAIIADLPKNDIPSTPRTPKPVEYCNLNVGNRPELNTYANLSLGDMADSTRNCTASDRSHKFSESDTFPSMSPLEDLEVNYAVLDIDANKEPVKPLREIMSPENQSYSSSKNESTTSYSSQAGVRLLSQSSTEKVPTNCAAGPAIGYTTIDFDKTVALTSVAAGAAAAEVDSDFPRSSRHNSSNMPCGSPSSTDKNKSAMIT